MLLTRPNGQLTRAGQFYHSITGRRPPSRQFDESQPLIRDGPNDYILTRGGARKLVRSLQPNGQYHVTKLGKAFFKDKFTEWLAHVPVIIRGRRRNGTPYGRHDYLPVTALEMGLSRQNDAWSDAQVARNVKEPVLRQLGQPGPDEPIYMISGEAYSACANRCGLCARSATSSSRGTRSWPVPSRSAKTCSACLDS